MNKLIFFLMINFCFSYINAQELTNCYKRIKLAEKYSKSLQISINDFAKDIEDRDWHAETISKKAKLTDEFLTAAYENAKLYEISSKNKFNSTNFQELASEIYQLKSSTYSASKEAKAISLYAKRAKIIINNKNPTSVIYQKIATSYKKLKRQIKKAKEAHSNIIKQKSLIDWKENNKKNHEKEKNFNSSSIPKCKRESCIINGESGYGFYIAEDKSGKKNYEINTSIGLLELPFEGMCYNGDFEEVGYIISALAENTNKYYNKGGKSKIKNLKGISRTENSMIIRVTIFSDINFESFTDDLILRKCTKQ